MIVLWRAVIELRIKERREGGVGGPRVVMVRFRWLPVLVVKGRGGQRVRVGVRVWEVVLFEWGIGGAGGFEGWRGLVFENGDGEGVLLSGRLGMFGEMGMKRV